MSHLTRREFLRSSGLAAAALGLHPRPDCAAPAGAAVLTRYSVSSAQGKKMLAILADAVTKMRALPDGDPRSWVFQWYTHLVKGGGNTPDAFETNMQAELQNVYPDAKNPNRKIAEAMWNTCEPHVHTERTDFFLPWHRMYVFYFEQIVRAVTGSAQFTLPYWDYTDPAQLALPAEFRLPAHPVWRPLFSRYRWPMVNAGKPIDTPPMGGPVTRNALMATTYSDCDTKQGEVIPGFCSTVQSDPHKQVHWSVGNLEGMMSFPYTARDPVFWLHHCNVDRMWASWNKAGGKNPDDYAYTGQAYTFVDGAGRVVAPRPTVGGFLDTSALGYVYDEYVPRPEGSPPFREGPACVFAALAASSKDAGPIRLRPSALTLTLSPEGAQGGSGAGPFAARVRDAEGRGELHLLLEGLSADAAPLAAFEVYLSGHDRGRHTRNEPTYLGAIEFMEAAHGHAGHGRAGRGRNHTFIVGPALRRLLAEPGVAAPQVTLVPTGPFNARSAPRIGRIVLGTLSRGA